MTSKTSNPTVNKWLEEMKELLTPDNIVWIDGSDEQREALRAEAVELGELTKLNQEKLPGCYLHRTNPNDVARVEDRTFICSKTKEDAGPTNNWCDPKEMYEKLLKEKSDLDRKMGYLEGQVEAFQFVWNRGRRGG